MGRANGLPGLEQQLLLHLHGVGLVADLALDGLRVRRLLTIVHYTSFS